ncbi:hypothetical protein C8R42DRAFT_709392, partial [Lentinula raphanica]
MSSFAQLYVQMSKNSPSWMSSFNDDRHRLNLSALTVSELSSAPVTSHTRKSTVIDGIIRACYDRLPLIPHSETLYYNEIASFFLAPFPQSVQRALSLSYPVLDAADRPSHLLMMKEMVRPIAALFSASSVDVVSHLRQCLHIMERNTENSTLYYIP